MDDLRSLTARFPRAGRVEAVYLRPGRERAAVSVASARALVDRGLEGDRSAAKPPSRPGGVISVGDAVVVEPGAASVQAGLF